MDVVTNVKIMGKGFFSGVSAEISRGSGIDQAQGINQFCAPSENLYSEIL
jgi:hypothetical protein